VAHEKGVLGFRHLDRFALTPEMSAGLDVFAGKGRCTRCHVPPLFGGSRPADFAVPVYGVLGIPSAEDPRKLDADLGRGALTHRAGAERAFKTPTVRNASRTAPYMHNGALRSLEAVIDFYDKGGGRALGFDIPNQDSDVRPLELTAGEKRALLVFMRDALLDRPRR
jgi:cytochrome c peroxidase